MQWSAPSWYDTGRAGLLAPMSTTSTNYNDDNVDNWWLSNYQSGPSGKAPLHSYPDASTLYFRHSSYLADDLALKWSSLHCISVFLIFVFLEFLLHIVNCWADSTLHLSNSADLGPSSGILVFFGHSWVQSFLAFLNFSYASSSSLYAGQSLSQLVGRSFQLA